MYPLKYGAAAAVSAAVAAAAGDTAGDAAAVAGGDVGAAGDVEVCTCTMTPAGPHTSTRVLQQLVECKL